VGTVTVSLNPDKICRSRQVLHLDVIMEGQVNEKCKGHFTTGHEDPEKEQSYSSTLSLSSMPRPNRFTSRKETRYPLYRGSVGPRTGLDGCRKSSPYRDSISG